jgi:hypothetical protein
MMRTIERPSCARTAQANNRRFASNAYARSAAKPDPAVLGFDRRNVVPASVFSSFQPFDLDQSYDSVAMLISMHA